MGIVRVVPLTGETTWSFLHRIAGAYGLQAGDLRAWWRWEKRMPLNRGPCPKGEVLLDAVAQAQVAGWCRIPAGHLARALPSWTAGPQSVTNHRSGVRDGDGRGWARWRTGALEWGPVVFACRLCAARRGADGRGWVYREPWQRWCARHGRWLLPAGDGHDGHLPQFAEVSSMREELAGAQRRWRRVEVAARAVDAVPGEVFALARAVVCRWWQSREFWEREVVWGRRLDTAVEATRRPSGAAAGRMAGWDDAQGRLLVRDAVVFPEIVAVAAVLLDGPLMERACRQLTGRLLRDQAGVEPFAAVLGERLDRPWLAAVETAGAPGPLARWAAMTIREQRRPDVVQPSAGFRGKWAVRARHRPVEAETGSLVRAGSSDRHGPQETAPRPAGGLRRRGENAAGQNAAAGPAGRSEAAGEVNGGVRGGERAAEGGGVAAGGADGMAGRGLGARARGSGPSREAGGGVGWGLRQREEEVFADRLERARRYAERVGHLALPHTGTGGGVVDGFDLGGWLARRRSEALSLTPQQAAQLAQLDPWWNPPWQVGWQRLWYQARAYTAEHGPVRGGDNLDGLPRGLQTWLRRQIPLYETLHPGQQDLLAELGLTAAEVERFRTWPARRRHPREAFAAARTHAARHGHLAVTGPTVIDGVALDAWLSSARRRQRTAGRPTRLGTRLTALDPWWNPPWALSWQKTWWAAHHHLHGLPPGACWWPGAPNTEGALVWLRRQHAQKALLQPAQQQLVTDLMHIAGHQPAWQPRISDQAWHTLTDLLPTRPAGDRRYRSERNILEAIAHIACTGRSWPHIPAELGSYPGCRIAYNRWHADGTLTRICHASLPESDQHWQQQLATYINTTAKGG